jgi:hypothetical protein
VLATLNLVRSHPRVTVVALTLLLAVLLSWGWWQHRYPCGWSPCCDKQQMFALEQYAEEHRARSRTLTELLRGYVGCRPKRARGISCRSAR